MRQFILTIIAFLILSATCAADQWPVLTKSQSGGHWPIIKNNCPGGVCPINKVISSNKIAEVEKTKVNFTRRGIFYRLRGAFR